MSTGKSNVTKWLLFLLSPILSFFLALFDAFEKNSKLILILFCGLAGWLMFPYNTDLDIYQYYEYIRNNSVPNQSLYLQGLYDFLSFDSNIKDYYFETVVYFVTQISSNIHFVFLVFGLIYGYFFTKSMAVITRGMAITNDKKYLICLLIILFITIPFTSISSVRFWTASWMATCISLKTFIENKYYYLLLTPFLVFIHGTYLIFIVFLCLTIVLHKIPHLNAVLTILVYLSIPLSYLSMYVGDALYNYLPTPLQHTADYYFSEDNLNRLNVVGSGFAFISKFSKNLVSVFVYILIVLLLQRRLSMPKNNTGIYTLTLLLLIFSNFTMGIPSLGGRFYCVTIPLVIYLWFRTFRSNEYKRLIYLTPFVFSFEIVYWVYYYVRGTTGILNLFLPPIVSVVNFL